MKGKRGGAVLICFLLPQITGQSHVGLVLAAAGKGKYFIMNAGCDVPQLILYTIECRKAVSSRLSAFESGEYASRRGERIL